MLAGPRAVTVAELADAAVAVALDDRAIGTKRAGPPRFAHVAAAEHRHAVGVVVTIHSAIVARSGDNSLAPWGRTPGLSVLHLFEFFRAPSGTLVGRLVEP